LEHCRDTNFHCEQQITSLSSTQFSSCKIFASRARRSQIGARNVRSEQNEKKKPPKTGCGDDAVILHEILAMRNLTNRIQELDQKLAQEFVSFNRISESIEKENSQILDLLLEPIVRTKRLEKARSQQQRDIARSFETEEQIGRLLEARSDAISDIARQQHELGRVR
jgi:hypothetical protein